MEFMFQHPELAVCGANAWMHQEDGVLLWATRLPEKPDEICKALWDGNPFVHGATLFRLDAARAMGGYCERFECSQDYDFFWRLCDAAGGANLGTPLYHYRFRRAAISAGRAAEQAGVHRATVALARTRRRQVVGAADTGFDGGGATASEGASLAHLLKQADHRLLAGDYAGSARSYVHQLRVHPASFLAWAKLARWLLFLAIPAARRRCFR
jgi:hypothetical protein